MDGTNRSVVISTKIYWPNGLTLDIATQRIYFADSKLDFIDFCYYNGTGRQQVLAGSHYLLHPHSLTLFEDKLYWTDRQLNRVLSADKFRGKNQTVVSHLISQPLSIHVNHPSLQPVHPNPCEASSCQQLCLLSPSSTTGYTCKCRPGFRTGSDGQCTEEESAFLMVMKGSQIVDVPLTPGDKTSGYLTAIVGIEGGLHLDYDRKTQTIFWVEGKEDDEENCTIFTTPYSGGNKTEFLGKDSGVVGAPFTIAFDWLGRNLFIGNRMASNIELVKVDGKVKHRTVILANEGERTSVAKPRSMCLDPFEGKLYWADQGGFGVPAKIGKVNMDGSKPEILVDEDIDRPEAVAIDTDKKLLFFSNQYPAYVKIYDLKTKQITTLLTEKNNLKQPKALAVHESRLFYLDPLYDKIERVDLPSGENPRLIMDNEADLKNFIIFKKRPMSSHPCLFGNGGCAQICIPAEGGFRTCACSIGYRKDSNLQCSPQKTFAIVSQLDLARGYNLTDHSEGMVPITGPGHHILHVDFHYSQNWIYWVEFNRGIWNGIYRIRPNGTELQPIIREGIGSNGIRGIAIDWVAGNLYFTNVFPHENYVEVCWLDGRYRKVIYKTTTDAPRELAVNPIKR